MSDDVKLFEDIISKFIITPKTDIVKAKISAFIENNYNTILFFDENEQKVVIQKIEVKWKDFNKKVKSIYAKERKDKKYESKYNLEPFIIDMNHEDNFYSIAGYLRYWKCIFEKKIKNKYPKYDFYLHKPFIPYVNRFFDKHLNHESKKNFLDAMLEEYPNSEDIDKLYTDKYIFKEPANLNEDSFVEQIHVDINKEDDYILTECGHFKNNILYVDKEIKSFVSAIIQLQHKIITEEGFNFTGYSVKNYLEKSEKIVLSNKWNYFEKQYLEVNNGTNFYECEKTKTALIKVFNIKT